MSGTSPIVQGPDSKICQVLSSSAELHAPKFFVFSSRGFPVFFFLITTATVELLPPWPPSLNGSQTNTAGARLYKNSYKVLFADVRVRDVARYTACPRDLSLPLPCVTGPLSFVAGRRSLTVVVFQILGLKFCCYNKPIHSMES